MTPRRLDLATCLVASLTLHACGDDVGAQTDGGSSSGSSSEGTPDGSSGSTGGSGSEPEDSSTTAGSTTLDQPGSEGGDTTSCPAELVECDGSCVDTRSDRAHCGACDDACDAGELCSGGACALTCGGDTPDACASGCFDLQSNAEHCGECDNACTGGAECVDGACACGADEEVCDDTCVDTQTHASHCGDCTTQCAQAEVCVTGECTTSCPTGQNACDSLCVDLQTDPQNCNGCGVACGDGEQCVAGSCAPSCAEPLIECDSACVDPLNDPTHCGDCVTECSGDGAVGVCLDGGCELLCQDGRADCDGEYDTGCEVDLTDNANCGGCGFECAGTCTSQGCVRHVFVTDTISNGNLQNLDGADATCQQEADAAGLGGTYLAWLSTTSTSPSERFQQSPDPYALPDGTHIANNWADLTDGSLDAPISLNAAGVAPASPTCPNITRAWTNTDTDGTVFNTGWTCGDWTQGSGVGHIGDASATNGQWTANTGAACNVVTNCGVGQQVGSRLYCFQQ